MTKCWYYLDIDVSNAMLDNWKFPTPDDPNYGVWQFWAHKVFRKDWLEYASSLGLDFATLMMFYRGPYFGTNGAHIDISTVNPLKIGTYALNWTVGGRDSDMVWYEMPPGELKISYTPVNTAYTHWPIEKLKEIDRSPLSRPTLVQVGLPHSITMGKHPRWSISVRPKMKKEMEWNEIVNHMKSLNILEDR